MLHNCNYYKCVYFGEFIITKIGEFSGLQSYVSGDYKMYVGSTSCQPHGERTCVRKAESAYIDP